MRHKAGAEEIFRQEMLKLRSEYIAYSLDQLAFMESLLQQWRPPHLTTDELSQLLTIAHRLRGSGQTYDLPEVTNWASILEADLRRVQEDQSQLTLERRRTILSVVVKLSSILETEKDQGSRMEDGQLRVC